jgi:hypothetical protein
VDIIHYGTDFKRNYSLPRKINSSCYEELTVKIAPGVEENLCVLHSENLEYARASDYNGLSFRDCEFLNVDMNEETSDHFIETYFNPNTLYTNEYYSRNDLWGLNSLDWYNGPGRMKITVGKAVVDSNGECRYTLRFCSLPAFVKEESDSTIDVFKAMQILELQHLSIIPYSVLDFSVPSIFGGGKAEIYYYNDFTINLDKGYGIEEIINAIKVGLYENPYRLRSQDDWTHPNWLVLPDYSMSYEYPWNNAYDSQLNSSDPYFKTREIRYNCGDDNICSGKLKIKVAIRRDYTTTGGNRASLSGVITFAEQNPDIGRKFNTVRGNTIISLKNKNEKVDFGSRLQFRVCHYSVSTSGLSTYEIFDKNTISVIENTNGEDNIFVAC